MTRTHGDVFIQEVDHRPTALGEALRIQVERIDGQRMGFRELWDAFEARYPGKYAVQVFPPRAHFFDQANKYHLFVLEQAPVGMDIFEEPPAGTRRA